MKFPAWRTIGQHLPNYHYVLLALFFFGGIELIFFIHRFIPLLVALLAMIVVAGVALLKAEEGVRFRLAAAVLPALAVSGTVSFSLFLPVTALVHLFMVLSALLLYFLLTWGAREAYPAWNWTLALVLFFLNAASSLGWRYYLYIPILVLLILIAVISGLTLWQGWRRLNAPKGQARLPAGQAIAVAAGGALVLTEVAWTLQFLPLHYLIQASILTAGYYLMFNLTRISLKRPLRRSDLFEYGMVGVVALFIVLLLARWR